MRLPRRKGPVGSVHAVRRTDQPGPKFNYELFNCNNFNIRLELELPRLLAPDLPSNCSSLRDLNCTHSNYKTQKSPVSVFIVTTSPCRDWVICAPAAFLGCGSRFSGSLSGIDQYTRQARSLPPP